MDGDKGKMVAVGVLRAHRQPNNRLAGPSAPPGFGTRTPFRDVDLARRGVFFSLCNSLIPWEK